MEFQIIKQPEESNAIRLSGRLDVAGAGVAPSGPRAHVVKSMGMTDFDKLFQIAPDCAKAGWLLEESKN